MVFMKTVYLSLGSNVGDRDRNLRAAIERLEAPDLHVLRVSPVYETEPMELTTQRWFLNQRETPLENPMLLPTKELQQRLADLRARCHVR